jgi:hypothetical protein
MGMDASEIYPTGNKDAPILGLADKLLQKPNSSETSILSEIHCANVTYIGNSALSNNQKLSTLDVPNLKHVGNYGCGQLDIKSCNYQ